VLNRRIDMTAKFAKVSISLIALSFAFAACSAQDGDPAASDPAASDPANSLAVEILPLQQGQGEISYRLTNTSADPVRFLAWETATPGEINRDLFDVRRDGVPVSYVGPDIYAADPQPEDFSELQPGESLTATVRLYEAYEMLEAGNYSVRARTFGPHVEAVGTPEATLQVDASDVIVSVDGAHLYESLDEKASSVCEGECMVRCAGPFDPTGCVNECIANVCNAKLTNCSAAERTTLETNEDVAAGRTGRSFAGLTSGNQFQTAFGVARTTAGAATVRGILTGIQREIPTNRYHCNAAGTLIGSQFVCGPSRAIPGRTIINAATNRSRGALIEVCPVMLTQANNGAAGTMVHEASHHFLTVDNNTFPLNNAANYRTYVMSF
jgi:hypothetical protein